MDFNLDQHDDQRSRAMAAAEITGYALERDLLSMALSAARETARLTLLALAAGPYRLSGPDMGLLRDMARTTSQHLAGQPAKRTAVIRATLSAVDRLLERGSPAPGAGEAMGIMDR
jgi:hypothetical protein